MLKSLRALQLIGGLGLLLIHFATPIRCFASEEPKTVEVPDPVAEQPPKGKWPSPLLSLQSETGAFTQYAFLVDKSKRTLTVWQHDDNGLKLVSAWPTDIGQKGGDKLVEGDKKTPEGVYFFQTSKDGRKVDFNQYGVRIFTLDYPNYFDRLEKKTGTGIWFHAIPDTKSLLRGSRGCVVVRNSVIDHLAQYIDLKRTPMVISNEVEYLAPDDWRKLRDQFKGWLEAWRQSWMGKDIESYLAQYSDRFMSNGMNKDQWRRYKKNLASRYSFIDVNLQDVQIFNQGPKIVLRFLQTYKSDRKQDVGAKIIYALKTDQKYEIIGESWEGCPSAYCLAPQQSADAKASTTTADKE